MTDLERIEKKVDVLLDFMLKSLDVSVNRAYRLLRETQIKLNNIEKDNENG